MIGRLAVVVILLRLLSAVKAIYQAIDRIFQTSRPDKAKPAAQRLIQ